MSTGGGINHGENESTYPPEFRQQMVELVKSGRTPNELAREYEPSAGVHPQLGGPA